MTRKKLAQFILFYAALWVAAGIAIAMRIRGVW